MEDSGQSPTLSEGLLMNERKFNRKRRGHETRTRKPIVFVAVEGRRNKTERYYLTEVYKIIDALVDAGYCVDSSKNN